MAPLAARSRFLIALAAIANACCHGARLLVLIVGITNQMAPHHQTESLEGIMSATFPKIIYPNAKVNISPFAYVVNIIFSLFRFKINFFFLDIYFKCSSIIFIIFYFIMKYRL
ncbi:hypothetical protein MCEREM21A_01760 [Sphingomonadaceae bacterium]